MTTVSITSARKALADLFNQVVRTGERVVIDRYGKDTVAMVPIEDLRLLEQLEDQLDMASADAAMAEPGESVSYDEIRKELGL